MFDIVKKLLFARELNLERGKISLLGHPIIMAPVSSFTEVRKTLEKSNSPSLLYLACKKSGIGYMETLEKKFKMKTEELLKWGVDTISLAGWGNIEILNIDAKGKRAIVVLHDSSFSQTYGKSKEPVCEVFRGYLAATATVIFGADCDAVEIKCKSMGDKHCEFVTKPKEEFDFKNENIAKQLKNE